MKFTSKKLQCMKKSFARSPFSRAFRNLFGKSGLEKSVQKFCVVLESGFADVKNNLSPSFMGAPSFSDGNREESLDGSAWKNHWKCPPSEA